MFVKQVNAILTLPISRNNQPEQRFLILSQRKLVYLLELFFIPTLLMTVNVVVFIVVNVRKLRVIVHVFYAEILGQSGVRSYPPIMSSNLEHPIKSLKIE